MKGPDSRTVAPVSNVSGRLRVPGDKSISHRAVMISAIASGESEVAGFLAGEDCLATLSAVERMGCRVRRRGGSIFIEGTGGMMNEPDGVIDAGNSGTSMRLLAGIAAGQPFTTEFTGDASLRSRPMKRIREPLEKMGARVELTGEKGCAPMRVTGGALRGIEYVLPVASAQVKSCVLLAGLFARGETTVIEPEATRDHTERMLKSAGADIRVDGLRISVAGSADGPRLSAGKRIVPGDFSSAAFWFVLGACRAGAEVTVENVGLNPRRTALLNVLSRMGAGVDIVEDGGGGDEPAGTVTVRGGNLSATEIGGTEVPNLIDEIPIAVVAACFAKGRTVIKDARELRVKESDRIAVMAGNLGLLGVNVEERPDGMIIEGPARLRGGTVESFDDHRIAMAMAVLAANGADAVRINGVACISTSYPEFWDHLDFLTGGAL